MAEWGIGDQLDRTAAQVRQGGAVHALKHAESGPAGRQYWTVCGRLLLKDAGAALTTEDANCAGCEPVRVWPQDRATDVTYGGA